MSKPVYSVCLYHQADQLGILPLPYTGGPDTIIIREIELWSLSVATAYLVIADEVGAFLAVLSHGGIAPSAQWQGRQVINPGGAASVDVFGANASVRISGYLLTP